MSYTYISNKGDEKDVRKVFIPLGAAIHDLQFDMSKYTEPGHVRTIKFNENVEAGETIVEGVVEYRDEVVFQGRITETKRYRVYSKHSGRSFFDNIDEAERKFWFEIEKYYRQKYLIYGDNYTIRRVDGMLRAYDEYNNVAFTIRDNEA
jgi:hypothetical protein